MDLSQNQIKNVGFIKEGIICNISLEKLDVSSNTIDNEGLEALAKALQENKSIETLAIGFNKYSASGLKKLFHLFETKLLTEQN
jgi:Ran GTPase-activating protein (RanGAP) involved in mRNA processing and transport